MPWKYEEVGAFNPTTDLNYQRVMDAQSDVGPQQPSGLGIANTLQINFGAAQGGPSDPVQLAVDGTVTINQGGTYIFATALQVGRTGGAGQSEILFRVTINGVQAGRTVYFLINNANTNAVFENSARVSGIPDGAVLRYECMRDTSGNNSGGLFGFTPSDEGAGTWEVVPTAQIRIERFVGA